MRIGSLFSGIGGLELGLEWAGLGHTVWQVEQSEFCRGVLARHWPEAMRFEDVHEVGSANLPPVDLICGGFPCQDVSSAGKGAGLAGERSGLWYQFARIIGEMQPRWVVVENVASGAKRWVDAVVSQLGGLGYETLPVPISAEAVGAPHRRARIFLVAHAFGARSEVGQEQPVRQERQAIERVGGGRAATNADGDREPAISEHEQVGGMPSPASHGGWHGGPPVSPVCNLDDGVPDRVDRLKALGNAVVPACSEVIGYVIRELAADRQRDQESVTNSNASVGRDTRDSEDDE